MLSTRTIQNILWITVLSSLLLCTHAALEETKRKLQEYGKAHYRFKVAFDEAEAEAAGLLDANDGGLATEAVICMETVIASNMDRLTRQYAKDVKGFHEKHRWSKVVRVSNNWKNLRYIVLKVKTAFAGIVEVFVDGVLTETRKVKVRNKIPHTDATTDQNSHPQSPSTRRRLQNDLTAEIRQKKRKKNKKKNKQNRRNSRTLWSVNRMEIRCVHCNLDNIDEGRRLVAQDQGEDVDYATWMNEKLSQEISNSCSDFGKCIEKTIFFEIDCHGHPVSTRN